MFIKLNGETKKWLQDGERYIVQKNNGEVTTAFYDAGLDRFERPLVEDVYGYQLYIPPVGFTNHIYHDELRHQLVNSIIVHFSYMAKEYSNDFNIIQAISNIQLDYHNKTHIIMVPNFTHGVTYFLIDIIHNDEITFQIHSKVYYDHSKEKAFKASSVQEAAEMIYNNYVEVNNVLSIE